MTRYQKHDGTIYDGPVVTMPDGRIKTGATLTAESERVFPILERARDEDGGKAPIKKKRVTKKKA
tara:strand:- start:17681 stop:17875 length:195 start_codon:yes stop_codon:yes gene_type:complete